MPGSELYGFKAIISDSVENGTLHVISAPPRREDYATEQDYLDAYWGQFAWAGKIVNIGGE